MRKLRLEIKPLSVNKAWQGRRFKTKDYKQFERDVSLLVPPGRTVEGYVNVSYIFFLKNWKMTDGDNLVKCLQDILVKRGVIEDDRKIMRYTIEKIPSKTDAVEVNITKSNIDNDGKVTLRTEEHMSESMHNISGERACVVCGEVKKQLERIDFDSGKGIMSACLGAHYDKLADNPEIIEEHKKKRRKR